MAIGENPVQDINTLSSLILERIRNRQMNLPELIQVAEGFRDQNARQLRAEIYKNWIAFNGEHGLLHLACFNYSVALRELGDMVGAINVLSDCLRLDPNFAAARINLGRAFEDCGQLQPAIDQWKRAADAEGEITPDRIAHKLMALQHIGRVLENTEHLTAAEDALRKAIELRPDKTEAGQHWIALRQKQCKWPIMAPSPHVSKKQLLAAMSPMALAAFADDPMFQLANAYRYNKQQVGKPDARFVINPRARQRIGTGQRLRIGYVSSDLREHAVGFALSEILELHDKSQFEIFAYYIGDPRRNDATHERIKSAVEHWLDIAQMTDERAAQQIAADQIDILVDLNGYTKQARTRIFAYRPAPVIVNWCGFPGTTGSPYHHYIVADSHIIPPDFEQFYSERVLRIPCNQPIDRKREIARQSPTRADAGLPESAFVFASMNGMQKVTANVFARWMTILKETQNSVLWLLAGDKETNARLREMASAQGLAPDRLVFAAKAPNPVHLARLSLADLFLDTAPYGAHSTAADALTMGLPILTIEGRSFASRFCASVVAAAGLKDMICKTSEEYVKRAIAFARHQESIGPYKEKLRRERDASVLRDIPGSTRCLEALYWQMQRECEADALPVPDLTNLDVYYAIGSELELETIEQLDIASYRALYAERLADWNAYAPIAHDTRLWRDTSDANAPALSDVKQPKPNERKLRGEQKSAA